MIAANHIDNVAKPDGLTLAWIAPTLYFDQLVSRNEVRYDWAKYIFIGAPAPSSTSCSVTRAAVPSTSPSRKERSIAAP